MHKTNLIVLAHAGGHIRAYNFLTPLLSGKFNLIALEYPGRGDRAGENLIDDIHLLTEDIYQQAQKQGAFNGPVAIFGHSMGAMVGMLLSRKVGEQLGKYPQCLIASGTEGPSIGDTHIIHHLPSDEFWHEMAKDGGIADEILNDQGLKEYFEPIFRADAAVTERYQQGSLSPIPMPITVFVGDNDTHADKTSAQSWQKETTMPLSIQEFPGGHFFPFEQHQVIAQAITTAIISTV